MSDRSKRFRPRAVLACLFVAFAYLTLTAAAVPAQQTPPATTPLKPVDTGSPRDTFRSFRENADALAAEWIGDRDSARIIDLARSARETMDFRSATDGASVAIQLEKILQLQDVLARLVLPDYADIPGPEQVGTGDVQGWVVPGTRIRIERKDSGPQQGEYLFSANTVSQIDADYHRMQHVPYQPGAFGVFAQYLADPPQVSNITRNVAALSQGLDTSSPRALLEAFLQNITLAYDISSAAETGLLASPPLISLEDAVSESERAQTYLDRAAQAFDLSETPVAFRADVGIESALRLKEVLDRIMLPPIEYVPDEQTVESMRTGTGAFRWTIPGTSVEVTEVTEGRHAGRFLFSAATVDQLPQMFLQLHHLSYRDPELNDITAGYFASETTPGFYESYISTPGSLVPSATVLGRFVLNLPDWFHTIHQGQTRWQWIGLVISASLTLGACVLVFRLADRSTGDNDRSLRHWVLFSAPIISAFLVWQFAKFTDGTLNITGNVLEILINSSTVIELLLVAFAIWRLSSAIAETIVSSPRFTGRGVDISLIRIVARMMGVVAMVWVMVVGLRELGIDFVPLVAGLGVGGLAGALAIRPTLENLIGGLILFADKPVRVGDRCTVGEVTGHVETIGIRSTQIRGLDRSLVSIPNAKFADMEIINWERLDRMLIESRIGLSADTSGSQLRQILAAVRSMLEAHPKVDSDLSFIRLAGHETSAQTLQVRIYTITGNWDEYFAIREEIMLSVADIVEEAGASFSADG